MRGLQHDALVLLGIGCDTLHAHGDFFLVDAIRLSERFFGACLELAQNHRRYLDGCELLTAYARWDELDGLK